MSTTKCPHCRKSLTLEQLRDMIGQLTREDAVSIRGAVNAALRITKAGGRPRTHTCSDPARCRICYLRTWRENRSK